MKWLYSIGLSLLTAFFISFSLLGIPNTSFAANQVYNIEINKKTNKLYLYKHGKVIKTYSVATGKEEDLTPEGVFKIGTKVKYPQWYNSEEKKVIPGWTEDFPKEKQANPLGPRWFGLIVNGDSGNTYGIHGTNNEDSIGKHVSAGCIRMHVKDVIELFDTINVPKGTSVWIHSGTSNQVWMNGDSIEDVKPTSGKVQITTQINIREIPSTISKILGEVDKNSQYNITGETKDWYQIKFNGNQVGFISKAYTKIVTETPNLDPAPDEQNPTTTSIDTKTSFTKSGELKIEATLPKTKQASGTWKITLDGKVIAEKTNQQPTYTFNLKNPEFTKDQVRLKVEFTGQADQKQLTGTETKTFIKDPTAMKIKPSFKNNKLHIEASLKSNQDAFGIWTIQLGETKQVYVQSGKKVTAIFDSVTFDKKKFPATVTFKGFTSSAYITASYTKNLNVIIPGSDNQQSTDNQDEQTDSDSNLNPDPNQISALQENLKGTQIQTKKPDTQTTPNDTENNNNDQTKPNSEQEEKQNQDSSNTNEQPINNSQGQIGGKLPKTATSYPIGILLGLSCLTIGWIYLRKTNNA